MYYRVLLSLQPLPEDMKDISILLQKEEEKNRNVWHYFLHQALIKLVRLY